MLKINTKCSTITSTGTAPSMLCIMGKFDCGYVQEYHDSSICPVYAMTLLPDLSTYLS